MPREYNIGIGKFLKTYAPNFCWCSAHDLLIMIEQELKYEDITENSFYVILSYLKKQGFFITKKTLYRPKHNSRSTIGNLYLRVK